MPSLFDYINFFLIIIVGLIVYLTLRNLNSSFKIFSSLQVDISEKLDNLETREELASQERQLLVTKVESLQLKTGSTLEREADLALLNLIELTPYTDLILYLNEKRKVMVDEAKRLLVIGVDNLNIDLLKFSFETIRTKLEFYADNISPDFSEYNRQSTPVRKDELLNYEKKLHDIFQYGNGSREILFIESTKEYIKTQLSWTFSDYHEWIRTRSLEKKTKLKVSLKDYIISLITTENNYELAYSELKECIIGLSDESSLNLLLDNLLTRYHMYRKDEKRGMVPYEILKNELLKISDSYLEAIKTIFTRDVNLIKHNP